jgi:hypothetical protein
MGKTTKREYLAAIWSRYRRVGRRFKSKILDEFCAICGYTRKYAIQLLARSLGRAKKRPGPRRQYDGAVLAALKAIWLLSEQMCSKRLKAALPIWLPFYEQAAGVLLPEVRQKILRLSPATIDRLLRPVRARYPGKGFCGTRPGTWLKHQIPIRTEHWDAQRPGYLEADTVAHCGNSLSGDFVWSLTFTDVFSQWTENRAVWNKGAMDVVRQIRDVEQQLPFAILAFDVDNGSEFLNHHLWRYFTHRPQRVHLTRSRPYKKNDQAHVEQKNWTHVRQLLGYQRIEDRSVIPLIDDLYRSWAQLHNFFCPTLKLLRKSRQGAKTRRYYSPPQTPYQRLLACSELLPEDRERLQASYAQLNPLELKKGIESKLRKVFDHLRTRSGQL